MFRNKVLTISLLHFLALGSIGWAQDLEVKKLPLLESSSLLRANSSELLKANDWEVAFWTVLDEDEVEIQLAIIGKPAARESGQEWKSKTLSLVGPAPPDETKDGEALAQREGDEYVYIFGSHFGSKGKNLQSRRQFIARFKESDVKPSRSGSDEELSLNSLDVVLDGFRLHRTINDALGEFNLSLIPREEKEVAYIKKSKSKAEPDEKGRINDDTEVGDRALNIEGAAFLENGDLLLGLRYPVTSDGHPIVVVLRGIERYFEGGDAEATVLAFWILSDIGDNDQMPRGIRAIERHGNAIHVITGSLESRAGTMIIDDHPNGLNATSLHHSFEVPKRSAEKVRMLTGQVVRRDFPSRDEQSVEGLALDELGHIYYIIDRGEDDEVELLVPVDQKS